MTVSVLCDIACELGEGPSYDPHSDTLWWFDIANAKLVEKPLSRDHVIFHSLPVMASVVARIDGERQLVAAEDGLYVRDVASGKLTLHVPLEADNPETRSNDGRVHPSGALWVGTMGKKHEKGVGAIYWYRAGEVRLLYPDFSIPNSICFSPDGATAYFTDTETNRIMRVACDPAKGLPAGEPKIFFDNSGDKGFPDGSVCDADGVVWNTRWGAGSLDAYSPEGKRIRSVSIPAKRTSCPAFAGPGFDRMAVTTAWQGLTGAMRDNDTNAGFTFIADISVNGRPEPDVAL
jgi:sugar lactone lactonase YvrE